MRIRAGEIGGVGISVTSEGSRTLDRKGWDRTSNILRPAADVKSSSSLGAGSIRDIQLIKMYTTDQARNADSRASGESMEVTFYGVRGSLPSPCTGEEVAAQLAAVLLQASQAGATFASLDEAQRWLLANTPFPLRSYYGGDTTCIYVRCGETSLIIDAGSGLRRLGRDLMPELVRKRGLDVDILFTHVHLDHIMGLPFFSPLFASNKQYAVNLSMYGGHSWQGDLQTIIAATLSPPLFPVDLEQLRCEAASVEYHTVHDGMTIRLGKEQSVTATCRRLHHPNETYGWRIECAGKTFVVATDTEPYAGPDPVLQELVQDADLLYVDAQYDRAQYVGSYDGIPRLGWGHGYAEWCGQYAREAGVRLAVTGHHDPAATNARIFEVGQKMQREFPHTVIGYDGMRARIDDRAVTVFGAGEAGGDLCISRDE